jgi:hypothetical protein
MASASKTIKGFTTALCPFCLDEEANVTMNLADLECNCPECGESFSPEQARDRAAKTLAAWEKICRWVEAGREIAAE